MVRAKHKQQFILLQTDGSYFRRHAVMQMIIAAIFTFFSNPLLPQLATIGVGLLMAGSGIYHFAQYAEVVERVKSLSLPNYFKVSTNWIREHRPDKDHFYLGKGYIWGTECTQQYHQLSMMPTLEALVDLEPEGGGKVFVHNIGKGKEENKFLRLPEHTIIAGTTGVGKTRTMSLLAGQALSSKQGIIIIDPKGDRDFLNAVYRLAVSAGRQEDFQFFSLLHPNRSGTFDLFGDCVRADEVADRVQSVLSSFGGSETSDPFIAFCWGLIHAVAKLQLMVQQKVSPKSLYQAIVINPALTLQAAEARLAKTSSMAERAALQEAIDLYNAKVINHSQEHTQKMTSVLIPCLTIMGTDETGELVSPEVPHIQIRDIIENHRIVFISLGSMAVTRASATLGKLFIQSIIGHIGKEYGYAHQLKGLHLFVDEFYSLAYPGFIEMLGKVRAAGVRLYLAMQSSSDIAAILGSVGVEQVITNTTNYIIHRIPEKFFAEVISERFGTTSVPQKVVTRAISAGMDKADNLFRSSTSERMQMVDAPRVSPEMLTSLPVGEAFLISQGLLPIKLVLPLVETEYADIEDFFDMINPELPYTMTEDAMPGLRTPQ